ncbi:aldolase/citrate lyase family protein [Nocardia sp. NPDC019395]|uniref:HpcH/HpaI aldolase family protein n=1 Tax=Nocardia sp. NPDC019395 TaxID=3154686 RepID=UPI0033C8E24F
MKIPGGEVVDLIALAGFDFAVLDLEHSQLTYAEARHALTAARANDLPMTVRIPTLDTGLVNRLIEAGAAGIQLSTVRSAPTASGLRRALRYGPGGSRSISLSQPAARYGALPLTDYLERHTRLPLAIGQLETADFDDSVADIVAALDVAFIGTLDLSVSAGTPGDQSSAPVRTVIDTVVAAAREAGTTLGIFAANPEETLHAIESGFDYIVIGSDVAMLRGAASQLALRAREMRAL